MANVKQHPVFEVGSVGWAALNSWMSTLTGNLESVLSPKRATWDQYIRLYKAIRNTENKIFPWKNCSNIFVPELANTVNGIVAHLISDSVEQSPALPVDFYHLEEEPTADGLERFLEYYSKVVQKMPNYWRKYLPYLVLLGTHCGKRTLLTPQESGQGLAWPKVELRGVPLNRLWAYPGEYDVQSATFIGDLAFHSHYQVYLWKEQGIINEEQFNRLIAASEQFWSPTDQESVYRLPTSGVPIGAIELLDGYLTYFYEGTPYHLRTLYSKVLRECLWVETLAPENRPYHMFYFRRDEDNFFGTGVGDMTWTLQEALNTAYNQDIDNKTIANMRMYGVSPNVPIENDSEVYPGKLWRARAGEVYEIKMGDIYPSTFAMQSGIKHALGEASGISEVARGFDSTITKSGGNASMAALNIQENARRLNLHSQQFADGYTDFVWETIRVLADYQPDATVGASVPDLRSDMNSLLNDLEKPGSGSLSELVGTVLDDATTEEVVQKVFSMKEVYENKGRFRIRVARGSSNRQVEQQSAMVLSQLVNQYLNQIIDLSQKITMLKQQPGTEVIVNTMTEGWKAANRVMKRILTTFSVQDAKDILITLQEVENNVIGQPTGFAQSFGGAPSQEPSGPGGGGGFEGVMGITGAASGIAGGAFGSGAAIDPEGGE